MPTIYANICKYMQTYANICQLYMQIYGHTCKYMQIYANICKYMQTYANIYKSMLIYPNIFQFLQIYANICNYISTNICSVSEFPFSGIIWAVRISNSEFAEELFGGLEFRITDSRQICLSAFRISN